MVLSMKRSVSLVLLAAACALALAAVILVLTRWMPVTKKLHPIVFIGAAAVVGVVFRF